MKDMEGDHQHGQKKQPLSLALNKKRFKSRRTLAPETLFIGWRLRAILMTILCDHYSSGKAPGALSLFPAATNDNPSRLWMARYTPGQPH